MPLGLFEREVLGVLAAYRTAESFVAGGSVIHQAPASPRCSRDVEIFHDELESARMAMEGDAAALGELGYEVETLVKPPAMFQGIVRRGASKTRIDWVVDSAFRFFPPEPDPEFGWRINFWDAATNKLLALAGRQAARDLLDTLYIHRQHLHLGALAWAAAGKDPGFSPEGVIDWARRNARVRPENLDAMVLTHPVDLVVLKREWLEAAEAAEGLIARLPMEEMGCLYLDPQTLKPTCPEPDKPGFARLIRHRGQLGGAWPQGSRPASLGPSVSR